MSHSFEMENRFGLNHKPKPITYSTDVAETLKILLWYAPNNNSYQAQQDHLIDKEYISDEIFDFFCSCMGIDPTNVDCRECGDGKDIDENIRGMTREDGTTRIIMVFGNSKISRTKMQSLLEHLRNSIAHGRFSITNDSQFIGFDYNGRGYTFFIRVGIAKLKLMLRSITVFGQGRNPYYVESMIRKVFLSSDNYDVIENDGRSVNGSRMMPDLLVRDKRLKKTLAIEIKIVEKIKSISRQESDTYLKTYGNYYDKMVLLLVIPNKVIAPNTISKKNTEDIVVLDRIKFKSFLNGEDVVTSQLRLLSS